MRNSADPGQFASSEDLTDLDPHCLQRQGITLFSRTRVKRRLAHMPEGTSSDIAAQTFITNVTGDFSRTYIYFMQIVSNGSNLQAMSSPVIWGEIRKIINVCICGKVNS